MTRKSKQPGGINPLTYGERKKLTEYGTQTRRLTSDAQQKFGHCCLTLQLAKDPVTTDSGHIYSREAIVSYLLTKNQEIKEQRAAYEKQLAEEERKKMNERDRTAADRVTSFVNRNEGVIQVSRDRHGSTLEKQLAKKIDVESYDSKKACLKRSSYWLSQNAPDHVEEKLSAPPDRPPSPMSGRPLRLKDLISLDCKVDEDGKNFQCAVSGKTLSTQEVVAITNTKQVMLKEVFDSLALPTKICPVTGQKFKKKHILLMKKMGSGFAASGKVEAKRYKHTLT